MTPFITAEYEDENGKYFFEIYNGGFSKIDLTKATQSYGVIYNNQNQIILVRNGQSKQWGLIGGTIEKGETCIDALNRECMEEGAISLKQETINELFYQSVFKYKGEGMKFLSYQLRYIAKLDKEYGFENDPGGLVDKIIWVDIDEIDKYLKWGQTTNLIIQEVKKYLKI